MVTQSYTWIGVHRQGFCPWFFRVRTCLWSVSGQYLSVSCWEMETLPINIYQALQKAKNLKTNYKKIIVFNIVLFLKMNEQVGESGANRWETEQEKACKKQGEKNAVQVDLLVRRRQVYPKKPRYNLLTPNQLEDKKKAATSYASMDVWGNFLRSSLKTFWV